ncbi:PREDICTED: uncharacterized protein LOC105601094 isoform X2 [Cercocebus atys]|uniref:uncharacterized protein LOC105601094 isoform X2 n=1 Tax=Cercocebus atys TaxID=9531 RepID=UPI0005F5004E|nr:PREDICTED: uncharacterized protein LOC105601094 isoform X2 [Cercocebus atys]
MGDQATEISRKTRNPGRTHPKKVEGRAQRTSRAQLVLERVPQACSLCPEARAQPMGSLKDCLGGEDCLEWPLSQDCAPPTQGEEVKGCVQAKATSSRWDHSEPEQEQTTHKRQCIHKKEMAGCSYVARSTLGQTWGHRDGHGIEGRRSGLESSTALDSRLQLTWLTPPIISHPELQDMGALTTKAKETIPTRWMNGAVVGGSGCAVAPWKPCP